MVMDGCITGVCRPIENKASVVAIMADVCELQMVALPDGARGGGLD